MRRIALLAIVVGFLMPLLASVPAQAQATRTWVLAMPLAPPPGGSPTPSDSVDRASPSTPRAPHRSWRCILPARICVLAAWKPRWRQASR